MNAESIRIRIGSNPLDVAEAVAFVTDERGGGISVFLGTTRRVTGDRETLELEYDAYPEMAASEMRNLADRALEEHAVLRVYVAHRLGIVPAGEASVVIAVSAPHRGEAFAACRSLIDRLKTQVPIWKKEIYADGNEEWVQGALPEVRRDETE